MAKNQDRLWEVVNITGMNDGLVEGEIVGRYASHQEAADVAKQGFNTVAPPWEVPADATGNKFRMQPEQSEEITRVAEEVDRQFTWDPREKEQNRSWAVIDISGTENNLVVGTYAGNFDSLQNAREAAEEKWNCVAVPWTYGAEQEVGSSFKMQPEQSEEIAKIAKTMDRGKEVTDDLVVCLWDGRKGPPVLGQYAIFDPGREHNGMARERLAEPLSRTGDSFEQDTYVMLRKADGIEREGEIIQIADRAEPLEAWVEQCRDAATFLEKDGLGKTEFTVNQKAFERLDEIRQQGLEEQRKKQHDQEI